MSYFEIDFSVILVKYVSVFKPVLYSIEQLLTIYIDHFGRIRYQLHTKSFQN